MYGQETCCIIELSLKEISKFQYFGSIYLTTDFSIFGCTKAHYLDYFCIIYGSLRIFKRDDEPEFRQAEFRKTKKKWR